ncbi:hypothetical protein BUQ74_15040 [Leptospira weilii serovar Heyan]|nr:hypothetical protein LEP1GSC086_1365 [Leptospira weilii str. LNT 1234]OMI16519.1 hypothetical protein BUQ74_15040 [Leptospira weilii serovar Heyan]QDK22391.1 hypothetical protein FHG67_06355 [Leptospira weilii]QDK26335.1 hypothetical protein FHG68_06275 [Leptospira weilii]
MSKILRLSAGFVLIFYFIRSVKNTFLEFYRHERIRTLFLLSLQVFLSGAKIEFRVCEIKVVKNRELKRI